MKTKIIIITLVCIFKTTTYAQRSRYQPYLSLNLTASTSHLLGDLGGTGNIGSNSFKDLNLSSTRFALGTGVDYNIPSGISIGMDIMTAQLYGDDNAAPKNSGRNIRNLHVRTNIVESLIKFTYTHPENGIYFSIGGGICFFKPMAKLNGKWHELRPLGTEGQKIDSQKAPYKTITPVIPIGFGKKFYLNENHDLAVAIDFSLRKTFTDYLDDVSTTYPEKDAIRQNSGNVAAQLSNLSNDPQFGSAGSKRGDPENNDNYFFAGFKLYLPLNKNYRNKWHRRYRYRGGRYRRR